VYYIGAIADATNAQVETNETNNNVDLLVLGGPITVY
jgi:subtilase family serine protease